MKNFQEKKIEEPKEELVIDDLRERELSQSEESKEEETLKLRSIQSIYDETNLMCNESSLLSADKPSSSSMAEKQKVWRDAIQEEISAILRNKTWVVVKLRRDINPIGVKWVFRVKKDSMGKTLGHKAK